MQAGPTTTATNKRSTIIVLGVLMVAIVLIFLPMMTHWQTQGDYTTHNMLANNALTDPATFFTNTPHFLYHVSVALMSFFVPNGSIDTAAAWVMVVCYVLLGGTIFWQLRTQTPWGQTSGGLILLGVVSLLLLVIAPIFFFTPENLYFGYFTPHVYHNPTMNIMKPFSVVLFFLAVPLFLNSQPLSRWWVVPFALLTFLSLVAKPSFVLAFVPTLGLLTMGLIFARLSDLWTVLRHPLTIVQAFTFKNPDDAKELPVLLRPTYINWTVLLGGIVIPAFAILLYQALTWTSSGGIGVDPFRVFFEWTLHYDDNADQQIALKFIMSAAFPIAVYALFARRAVRSLTFNLAWLLYLVSAAYAYLMVDYTVIAAGDFTWSSQIAALVLQISAMGFLLRVVHAQCQAERAQIGSLARIAICGAIFAAHVVAGGWWYWLHYTQTMGDLIYIWW